MEPPRGAVRRGIPRPVRPGVENPLWAALDAIPDAERKTVADLGCGTGPLLPYLVGRFGRVIALDFAPGMIERAGHGSRPRRRAGHVPQRPMHELDDLAGQVDVAVAVNSLVMPDVRVIDRTLRAIRASLEAGRAVPGRRAVDRRHRLSHDAPHGPGPRPRPDARGGRAARRVPGRAPLLRLRLRPVPVPGPAAEVLATVRNRASPRQGRIRRRSCSRKVLYPWDESLAGGEELAGVPQSWDWFFQAS